MSRKLTTDRFDCSERDDDLAIIILVLYNIQFQSQDSISYRNVSYSFSSFIEHHQKSILLLTLAYRLCSHVVYGLIIRLFQ